MAETSVIRDPAGTKKNILEVATKEFAANGYAGARVDTISELTRTTKRMIYYYFGSKEGLYIAALEGAYAAIRRLESELDVEALAPVDALRAIAEATYEHHTTHQEFVRLVAIENIHQAELLAKSEMLPDLGSSAVAALERVLEQGVREAVFHADVDALDLHMAISAYAVFPVANRFTFQTLFGRDLLEDRWHARYRKLAGDMAVATATGIRPTAGDCGGLRS